ncbi:hypothetical protein AB0K15_29265 [Amycolatopsis sp. NPDC049253]|uniref:hypothetical protein n=1 Tax=Amycolatopsis sp. NPDC049253 TaxID=3155274 RepID=UPI0034425AA9
MARHSHPGGSGGTTHHTPTHPNTPTHHTNTPPQHPNTPPQHPNAPQHPNTPPPNRPGSPPQQGNPGTPAPGVPPQGHQPDDPRNPNRPGQDEGDERRRPGQGEDEDGNNKGDEDKDEKKKKDDDDSDEPEDDDSDDDDDDDSDDDSDDGGDSPSSSGGDPGAAPATSPSGFDEGSSISEQLQPPEDTSGEDIQDLVKEAGVEVMAVEWIFQQLTGQTLTQMFIEPITGDFSKISADAEAWRNIAEAMKAFSTVMVGNEKILGESWSGPASLAHKAYVDLGWRAGLAAEAGIAELIAKGFELLSDTSQKLAAKALDLLKSLIDRLLVMAAEACVPIAGWIADAITGLSEILPLINALISIIDMIKDIVQKVGDLWNSVKDIGSQLAKIKDVGSISDVIDIGKGIAGDVGDIKDNASDIAGDVGDIKDSVKDGAKETRENHQDNKDYWDSRRGRTPAHSGSGRISGRIDD